MNNHSELGFVPLRAGPESEANLIHMRWWWLRNGEMNISVINIPLRNKQKRMWVLIGSLPILFLRAFLTSYVSTSKDCSEVTVPSSAITTGLSDALWFLRHDHKAFRNQFVPLLSIKWNHNENHQIIPGLIKSRPVVMSIMSVWQLGCSFLTGMSRLSWCCCQWSGIGRNAQMQEPMKQLPK